MDQQKHPEASGSENWLDDVLKPQNTGEEIGIDEDAALFSSLKSPNEAELDQLLEDIKSNDWANETIVQPVPVETPPEATDSVMTDATMVVPGLAAETAPAAEPELPPQTEPVELFRDDEFRDTFGEGKELEAVFASPAAMEDLSAAAQPPAEAPDVSAAEPVKPKKEKKTAPSKRRPKHKKGYGFFGIPHILATCIWIGLAVMIGTSLGNVLWLMAADVLAFNQEPQTVTITITEEDTLDTIAEQLQEKDLIRYPWLFKLFAEFTGKAEDISAGSFTLNKPDEDGKVSQIVYDYNALLNSMRSYAPALETVENLLIPEGYTCKQIFQLLEDEGVCTVAELEEYAANGELADYWFLEGVERGHKYCLEGYLFPDTYNFYKNDDPQNVLQKMLDAFDDRFTDKMHEGLIEINNAYTARLRNAGYSEEYIAENQIGIREVVIIASMIEKESAGSDENYTISSVIYNRMVSRDFPLLQIDATVVYAWGGDIDEVLYEHMAIDDPHNTYMYEGLPIGPISNPGRDALYAAMSPTETDVPYYYYALNPDTWKHEFFSTYREFEAYLYSIGYYD